MAWRLEIHHLDVEQGDATLIIAREVAPLAGTTPIIRSVLIDGGHGDQAPDIHNYITGTVILDALDVMIVTHYDQDHFGGITQLLKGYKDTYDKTIIFDQGWPAGGLDDAYLNYVCAVCGYLTPTSPAKVFKGKGVALPERTRITKNVSSSGGVPDIGEGLLMLEGEPGVPDGAPRSITDPPKWLVGQEVMWMNELGDHDASLWGGRGAPAPGAMGGPPSLLCIAANEWVLQGDGTKKRVPGSLNPVGADAKNAGSLGFLLTFEGFRYYIAGDLTSVQEDYVYGTGAYLAPLAPIQAMKASHHGSGESTSAAFIGQLQPTGVFISSKCDNSYGHPQQRVLDDLQVSPSVLHYYMTEDRSLLDFCRRLNRGVGAWPQAYTAKGVVAGAWGIITDKWGEAPDWTTACNSAWPNDGADEQTDGHVYIEVNGGVAPPQYTVTFARPAIKMPVLNVNIQLPAEVEWPNGQPLPAYTALPAGTTWPGGLQAPVGGMRIMTAPFTLIAPLTWPNGQVIAAGIMSTAGVLNLKGWILPAVTVLPAGVVWSNAIMLPVGGSLPAGTIIPAGIHVPPAIGWIPGMVLAGVTVIQSLVYWPANTPLPAGTIFPDVTVFPSGSYWPAGVALPAVNVPHGTALPVGISFPVGFVFPPGTLWPAGIALPDLLCPAGVHWPAGQKLPANTQLPAGATLPGGIKWPAEVAIPVPIGLTGSIVQLTNTH